MAKVEALNWKSFMKGEIELKIPKPSMKPIEKYFMITTIIVVETIILNTVPVFAGSGKTVATLAMTPDFTAKLSAATAPIHSLIKGFAHEIYGVFMSWGAIEAMIGKPQQGFTRMKVATLGYVLLFWVPWIVDAVNGVRPVT
jgi:hypothetical protein